MKSIFRIAPALVLLILSACAGDLTAHADAMAGPAGLRRTQVQTAPFLLTAYSRIGSTTGSYDVYIEGDGLAWRTPSEPSPNPTPHKALGLALAAHDEASNVIYIARPCQFTPLENDPHCDIDYWTDKRFSEEVIASVNQAIDKLVKSSGNNSKLNLIGYSGGGAVAVLVAARRNDVATIRTVAGNLDHDEVNRTHNVSLMPGSLNAIDQAAKIAMIPQLHFSGDADEIIVPAISQKFRDASGTTNCVRLEVIKGASHEEGWIERWPALLKEPVTCN